MDSCYVCNALTMRRRNRPPPAKWLLPIVALRGTGIMGNILIYMTQSQVSFLMYYIPWHVVMCTQLPEIPIIRNKHVVSSRRSHRANKL